MDHTGGPRVVLAIKEQEFHARSFTGEKLKFTPRQTVAPKGALCPIFAEGKVIT